MYKAEWNDSLDLIVVHFHFTNGYFSSFTALTDAITFGLTWQHSYLNTSTATFWYIFVYTRDSKYWQVFQIKLGNKNEQTSLSQHEVNQWWFFIFLYRQQTRALKTAKLQLERSTQSLLLAGSSKQNLTKLPTIIFLPLAAYFLNIALSVIKYKRSKKSKSSVTIFPGKFPQWQIICLSPVSSDCLSSISMFHTASSQPVSHPALHLTYPTMLITILCHALYVHFPWSLLYWRTTGRILEPYTNSQIPGDIKKDCLILQNQLLLTLKVQLRFQLSSQQDATKEESPTGSFGFILFHFLCPALAAAKSSYKKKLTMYSPG